MNNEETNSIYKDISDEELRSQIKGNLMIAADSWPIHQLAALEKVANSYAIAGIYGEGLLYSGIMDLYNKVYDKQGNVKLSVNPDDNDSLYKVLAETIATNKAKEEESKTESSTEEKPADKETPSDSGGLNFF